MDGVFVVAVQTQKLLTPDTAKELQIELADAINAAGVSTVTIDFEKVKFVSSVCLLSLLAVRRLSGVEQIVFCNMSTLIHSVFEACGLINVAVNPPVFSDGGKLDEAVARLSSGSESH